MDRNRTIPAAVSASGAAERFDDAVAAAPGRAGGPRCAVSDGPGPDGPEPGATCSGACVSGESVSGESDSGACACDPAAPAATTDFAVLEYRDGRFAPATAPAIREVPLTVFLNGREVVTLLCTARHPRFLALGFLKSDGLLRDLAEVRKVDVDEGGTGEERRIVARVAAAGDPWQGRTLGRTVTSGCGKGTDFGRNLATIARRRLDADVRVRPGQILALCAELHERSTLYRRTGGCHNASLCTPERMLVFREDIGRHNAIDMIVGQCFEEGVPTGDKLIVSSGRAASEILLKVVRIGVSVLVSSGAATSMAVDLARRTGLTLVGRVRGDSFCVYNDPGRIVRDAGPGAPDATDTSDATGVCVKS
ncbi:MAG: formate dehydrogenase accessory sulfurtransferase FdhD [Desulfovibrionaceae bacterium]|nr:formate dehydrogenase accessory sulfurtransferase FdhD [Desulfovibrionaceae bacterium]